MSNMHIHQAMLSPVAMDGSKVGTNILARQPDVEVAAMLLRPLPLTTGKFAELAGGKDFMTMQFVVLEVGGPGFSSVPYGKKGEKPVNPLPLYTRTQDGGHTIFHTFKKVESNLERGPRSSTEEGADGPVDLACTIAPGLSLSMFIRPDNFKGNVFYNGRLEGGDRTKPSELQYVKLSEGSPYWATDVIPEHTVVFLQVGVCNAEQALKGNMLKIKRIMPADAPGTLGPALEAMPRSLQAFEDNMQSHKDKFPGLQRSLYAGNSRLMAGEPDKHAYSNYDEATASFVLCDFGGGISEVHIAEALVSKAFSCTDKAVCQKMLDVAIAARAIQVLIRSSVNRDDVDMGSGGSAYAGALIHVDTNKLLGLDLVKQHGFATDNPDFQMLQSGRTLFWSVAAQELPEGRVVYVLDLDEVKAASNTASCEAYLSWGCAGRFRRLRVCLEPLKGCSGGLRAAVDALLAKEESEMRTVTSMQLRTQFAKARAASSKRKRATLVDEQSTGEEEEELVPATP